MNEKPEIEVGKLPVITKFIYTLGVLPTSYLMSMTYQEQVTWLYNYIQTEVIPLLNTESGAIQELQTLYELLRTYVNDYFDNLDVEEEINNKLDQMYSDGSLENLIKNYIIPIYEDYENSINQTINEFDSRLSAVASGSPLVATATSEMTDTSRVYVNTSDGKWYYYNGTTWTIGGTYQSTGISNNEIAFDNLDVKLQKQIVPLNMTTTEYSITGQFYAGTIGSEISTTQMSNWWSSSMDVNPGDTLSIPYFPKGISFSSVYPLFLTDENNIIIARYNYNDIAKELRDNSRPFTLKIPNNVSKIFFNNNNTPATNQRWYPFIYNEYNYNDYRLTNYQNNPITLNYSSVIQNKVYSLYSWDIDLTNFKTTVFEVNPLDKINITNTIPENDLYVAGIYMDEDIKPVGYTFVYGTTGNPREVTVDDIVPANAKYIYCSSASNVNPIVKKYLISDIELSETKKMSVSLSNGTLSITNNINGNNLTFKNFGGNNLFMIYSYKVGSQTINTSTDMIPAPYIVKAVNNIDGDKESSIFTGGNHQWNNQSSGSTPTARQISLAIYCDDVQLTNNSILNCDNVKIIEVNRVQGWNTCKEDGTGREILEEKIIFNFDGTSLKVINTITPLEEIIIQRYYGIQTALFNNTSYKVYADKIYDVDSQSSVPKKPDIIFAGNILSSRLYDGGLGNYQYNTTSTHKVNISNGKSYYAPIYNNEVHFTTSDVNYIIGEYVFDKFQI